MEPSNKEMGMSNERRGWESEGGEAEGRKPRKFENEIRDSRFEIRDSKFEL